MFVKSAVTVRSDHVLTRWGKLGPRPMMTALMKMNFSSSLVESSFVFYCLKRLGIFNISRHDRGGSRIFFRRGCTRLLLYFNANKPHSFFWQNTSCIRKPQVISGGWVRTPCTLPLDLPLHEIKQQLEVILVLFSFQYFVLLKKLGVLLIVARVKLPGHGRASLITV